MAVLVKIPTQLRAVTDGEAEAEVDGGTVGEVLDSLFDRFGDLRDRICDDGDLRRFVNVYVGGGGGGAASAAPLVTVAVATRDRPARLAALLEGLRAQTLGPEAFEVVVVDDGSGPQTAALLDVERARGEPDLVVLRHERARGPSAARNTA